MKSISAYFIFFILFFAFSSCKKENGPSPSQPTISQLNQSQAVRLFSASLSGAGTFTITDNAPVAIRTSYDITIYAVDYYNSDRYFTLNIPLDAYNGASYSTASSCTTNVQYHSSSGSTFSATCSYPCHSCTIVITEITANYIKGSFSGNLGSDCNSGSIYTVGSGSSFVVAFQN